MPGQTTHRPKGSASDFMNRTPTSTNGLGKGSTQDPGAGRLSDGSSNSFASNQLLNSPGQTTSGPSYYDLGDASRVAVDHGVTLPESDVATTGQTGTWDDSPNGGYTTLPTADYGGMVEMQQSFGVMIDQIVPPRVGGSMAVKAFGKVSGDGIEAGAKASLEAERTDEGFEITGGFEMEIGVGTANNKISFTMGLAISGKGDDAVEAMNLIGLVMERTMRNDHQEPLNPMVAAIGPIFKQTLGDKAADLLWGRGYHDTMLENMDKDDEASMEGEVGVEAEGGEKGADLTFGVKLRDRETWKKGTDEKGDPALVQSSEQELEAFAGVAVEIPPGLLFDIDGSFTFPSVNDCDFSLTVGCGLNVAEMPQATVMAGGLRQALKRLESLGKRLGDSLFGDIVKESSTVYEVALASEKAVGRTYFDVKLDYSTLSGDLTVTVHGRTKFKKEEKEEMTSYGLEGDVSDVIGTKTIHVGR